MRSCYEAGRDGFWLHRYLTHQGLDKVVVDSTSIEVNRRARRAKSGWRSGGEDFRCPRIRTGSALMIGGRGWQLGKLLPYDWRAGLALALIEISDFEFFLGCVCAFVRRLSVIFGSVSTWGKQSRLTVETQ